MFITTHHWVGRDKVMIDNERALLKVIEPYNVKILLNGHGHSDLLWEWGGMAATMNKGLYRGYEKVEVDPAGGEVRLSRRTTQRPDQRLLTTILGRAQGEAADLRGRRGRADGGHGTARVPPGPAEARWDGGAFAPVEAEPCRQWASFPGSTCSPSKSGGRPPGDLRDSVRAPGPLRPRWRRSSPAA